MVSFWIGIGIRLGFLLNEQKNKSNQCQKIKEQRMGSGKNETTFIRRIVKLVNMLMVDWAPYIFNLMALGYMHMCIYAR